ncbi:MAG: ThiF family adenylyltransferase [Cyanobacteria bacterium]|nr:ThiF family adenylyltransferase [Cyanobacteriota bacterium]
MYKLIKLKSDIRGLAITLSAAQLARYRDQLSLPGMTNQKQERLLDSHCLLICGEQSAEYAIVHLVQAGIGKITLALENESSSVNEMLVQNPDVELVHQAIDDLPDETIRSASVVLETSNDWQYKLRLSDICMHHDIALVHSGVLGPRVQLYTMVPSRSACLRCALQQTGMDDIPLTPVSQTSLRPMSAWLGALMALEAIKLITKLGVTQGNELWKMDGLSGELEIVRGLDPQRGCPDCG